MSGIVDWSVQQTRLMMSLLFFLVGMGIFSYVSIPKEADPDIPIPFVYVGVSLDGVSPEDGERLILRPLENQLRTIEGVKEIRSFAQQGYAALGLEFDVSFDQDQALIDVREKVDLARADLPEDAEEPIIQEFNASLWPVISIMISGELPERALRRIAERLQDEVEAIPTVLEAEIVGAREELLEVAIDPARLESYNVTPTELYEAVTLNNRLVPAGSLDTRFAVKVPGLFETRDDVLGLPIKTSGDTVVTLGDLADIRRTFIDQERYARFNGQSAVALEVTKRIGENIVETITRVRAVVEAAKAQVPPGVTFSYVGDASVWIDRSLTSLEQSVMLAILLVMIVVVGALGFRSGMIVGLAIPTSFMISFLFLALGGYTVNMMVMFGMILSVGMLVDGAIVMIEYADRKMAEGLSRREAYIGAGRRMFWPIISSAATTIAAFAPMLFWPGVSGKFMEYFPITVIIVLSASTIVALLFLPVVGSLIGKAHAANEATLKALAASETGDIREVPGLTGAYARLVGVIIYHPGKVIVAAILTLFTVYYAYGLFGRGVEFFVEQDPEQASVLVMARGNLSAVEKRDLVMEVERRILSVPGIKGMFMRSGGSALSFGGQGSAPSDTIGTIAIELQAFEVRGPGKPIIDAVRERVKDIPGIYAEVREFEGGPPTGKDINMELTSDNHGALLDTAGRIRAYLDQQDDLRDVEDSRPLPGIEWQIAVDRTAAGQFGADVTAVGNVVQLVTNGIKVGEYRPDDSDEEIDIRVRFPLENRSLAQIGQLRVPTAGGLVPISSFVTFTPAPQVNKIERVDGKRVLTVRANMKGEKLASDKVAEIRAWMESQNFPQSVIIKFRGANEESDESAQFLAGASVGALLLMFVILMVQFNNFWHCVIILSAVIMSTIGVMLGMLVMNQTFSIIMTGTGIVALAGVVVNNNIVLIDTFQYLLQHKFSPLEAIVRTGAQRLRPVFLTTITTILGLLPMMLQASVNFFNRTVSFGDPETLWWTQLATAVVWGLGFSTILTLIVTPALLALPYRIAETGAGSGVFKWIVYALLFPYYMLLRPAWRAVFGGRKVRPAE
ncbi:MAG: efflux RND transporter permease subunit [Alphaproteobacteria bacterium]|nr:efflux RND transporter permease subunit [Alphaproteobacteria bacterium]